MIISITYSPGGWGPPAPPWATAAAVRPGGEGAMLSSINYSNVKRNKMRGNKKRLVFYRDFSFVCQKVKMFPRSIRTFW